MKRLAIVAAVVALMTATTCSAVGRPLFMSDYKEGFGSSGIDISAIQAELDAIQEAFDQRLAEVYKHEDAFFAAKEEYTSLVQTLSNDLITINIVGDGFTKEQKFSLRATGKEIGNKLITAVRESYAVTKSSLSETFSAADANSEEDQALLESLIGAMADREDEQIAQARELSRRLNRVLMGSLNGMSDRVKPILDEMSELMEEASERVPV